MKKLLVTASTFPRWKDDTEPRFILDLCIHMTNKFDITVLVPASPGAKSKEDIEGVHVIRYHYFPIHKWETLCYPGAIVPRIREKKIRIVLVPFLFIALYCNVSKLAPKCDMVHAHWLIPQGIVQSFCSKPYIVTGHGGDVTSLNKGIIRKLKIRCLKKATHVTCVSEHLKKKIGDLVPDLNPSVISMGVDINKFGKQYFEPNYFEQGNKKVILFVGRLAEKKGVTYLIEAMRKVDAILAIVGDGPLKKQLMEQASDMKEKVKFLGAKTHNELKTIYASADVFVAPSVTAKDGDQEGMPTTIMEALASEIPIVASDTGGITQIIRHDFNGVICREKNIEQLAFEINRIIHNQEFRNYLVMNEGITKEKYSYEEIANKFVQILESI